jgi:predicted PurR-regulated permease PerM
MAGPPRSGGAQHTAALPATITAAGGRSGQDGTVSTDGQAGVPSWLVLGSEWAWRLLVIAAAVAVVVFGASYISVVVVPIVVSVFACAILEGVRSRLIKWGIGPGPAAFLAFLVGILIIAAVIAVAVSEIVSSFDQLANQFQEGINRIGHNLADSPLDLNTARVQHSIDRAFDNFRDDPGGVLSGAFTVLSTTGGLLAGGLLAAITTLFLMTDRARIVTGLSNLVPRPSRPRVVAAASASWYVLVSYVRVTLTEAVVTSVVIGAAAAIAGLPIAFALGALVFLLGFIPIVGAILSGTVVVLVALVTKGMTQAIVLAIVVLVVQQLDANVLYPYLTHRRISMHPLMALLLVAAGGVVGGLFGAFIAVPLAAMVGAAYRSVVPSVDPSIIEP